VIVGGAGTGKTMLAMEKAQQLAEDDMRVLFLAYNRNIVSWIDRNLSDERITVSTYHSLTGTLQKEAGLHRNRDLDWDTFTSRAPDLLLEAAEAIRRTAPEKLWDSIIIDEGQDFEDAMWIPVPDLLKDPENGILYIFFDDNQRLYTQISNIPMDTQPFYLTDNCRNTQRIHTTMTPYAVTDDEIYCDGPQGRDVEIIPVTDKQSAQKELQSVLHRLVQKENIRPEDIIVLTPLSDRTSMWKSDLILGNFALTWDMQTEMNMAIRVCTIYSFKGLESAVIILTELDKLRSDIASQLLYVGLSRARHHAVVLGELPEPNHNQLDEA
jgi:superfamily I DNA and RNA helicase